ncbi:transglycosylase SLT domain-containing protein [Staphylococcus warneri]|jgi:hypothetical protein|uniref:transglycosylase SLT domain-containing protein n=2 Tax=Staphylococcus warneri TaxID=1292 RepID=UPI000E67E5BC|nr:transglycosylase SLT domain-containing protein [Staphylococcus warneri]QNQ45540.1 transglycosylase SLT domain-containing protein [Staphylococcus warneri]RIN13762.1 transglycosylase [Staphylococcus warneri]VED26010.1 Immunodominant staphylococcal antigen A precursor [Staphylococcus warneri]
MKKAIVASSLAVALGVTGYSAGHGHEAHASEQNVNQAHLADLAQNHPEQLNESPVQEGSYDIHFTYNGFNYNFTSDGTNWSWDYKAVGETSNQGNTESAQTTSTQSTDYSQSYNQQGSQQQAVASNTQSDNANVEAVSAPSNSTQSTSNSSQASGSSQSTASQGTSSTKLGNGNTPGATGSSAAQEMEKRTGVSASTWEHIIARESNGQSNAQNPSGASGLFQTMPGWGSTASVSDQIDAAEKAYKAQGMSAWGM